MADLDLEALERQAASDFHAVMLDPFTLRALLTQLRDAERKAQTTHDHSQEGICEVCYLETRLRDAERERDRLRDGAQRLIDGWRAEADKARATGLTIEAVRDIVEAWDRTDISFSRMVEDLRTLAMVRAETAERERDEARAQDARNVQLANESAATMAAMLGEMRRERDEARAEIAKLHGISLDVMRERDEARAALAEAEEREASAHSEAAATARENEAMVEAFERLDGPALIRAEEDLRSAHESLETYEERIRDIADHVLGIQPPDVATIVLLDAIERQCGEERIAARQAEAVARDQLALIESGRAAHNEERVARDQLARENAALRAVAAAARECLHQYDIVSDYESTDIARLRDALAALDAAKEGT